MNELDARRVDRATPRYPIWATPLGLAIACGFFIAALGGPETVYRLGFSGSAMATAAVSASVAILVMLALEWRRYRGQRRTGGARSHRGSRRSIAWTLGGVVLAVVAARAILGALPGIAPVLFGFLGGIGLISAVLVQWESRYPPPQ